MPVFLFACAGRFGAKIRPLQLQQLAISAPAALSIPQKFVPHFRGPHSPPRGRFGFKSLPQQNKKTGFACLFCLAEKAGFFANFVACRAAPPHSRFLRFANMWRQKHVPDTFSLALQIPSIKTKKAVLCTAFRLSKKSSLYWAFLRKCGIMDAGDENVRRKEK